MRNTTIDIVRDVTIIQTVNPASRHADGSPASFEKILDEAFAAADAAIAAKGPEDMNAFDCGFAWVTLRPATGPFVNYCRKQFKAKEGERNYDVKKRYGHKGWNGGWEWWGPGNFNGQAIGHKQAGANAFRDVLALYGISAEVGSRLD